MTAAGSGTAATAVAAAATAVVGIGGPSGKMRALRLSNAISDG